LFFGEWFLKFLFTLFPVLAALVIYVFFRKMEKPEAGIIAAAVFLFLPGVNTYGVLNYTEGSLLLFFTLSVFFGYYGLKENKKEHVILSGIFSGVSFLTDITGAFSFLVVACYFVYEKAWKELKIFVPAAGLMVAPYFLRNLILFGNLCTLYFTEGCGPVSDVEIETYGFNPKIPAVPQVGVGASVFKFGWGNYFNFAFGWGATLLLFLALPFFLRRDNTVFLLWFGFFLIVLIQQGFFGGRSEDVVRYTLFGYPVLAMLIGDFLYGIYRRIENKHIALVLVVVLVFSSFIYGFNKLNGMFVVKHRLESIEDACKWIRENTPKDALFFGIYAHQEAYQCDRRVQSVIPDANIIKLWANETSYERLKAHGYDYVIIEWFTLTNQPYGEGTPIKFLEFVETSDKFRKVFDNNDKFRGWRCGTPDQRVKCGISVYEVL
ncbi:MAG: glycosyltransferase family 39 protein, partial [Candidatus Micrarchaeota archaeon]|nr:glycosyltransferase family 39 protein [Candidatus Micrarchaeota archaeon]